MVVPARLSQVETRGEWIPVPYIHRVLESDVIHDSSYILQVMQWGIHCHLVFLVFWQATFLGRLGTFKIIKDVG
jgi:hypothetical protein